MTSLDEATRFGLILDKILDRTSAAAALKPVHVSEGWDDQHEEQIMLGVVTGETTWPNQGALTRNEDTTTDIHIYVRHDGWTATQIRKRAIEITNAFGSLFRDDPAANGREAVTLDGLCGWSSVGFVSYTPGVSPEGRDGLVELKFQTFKTRF